MTWALLGLLLLIVCVASIIGFLVLQSVSQTLSHALSTLERVHTNDGKRIDSVLDRLMAMDFETFKNYQLAEEAEVGGIEEPEEVFVRLEGPGIDEEGLGARSLSDLANERRLLLEDFPADEEAVS